MSLTVEAQLAAARKTIDVLQDKVIDLYNGKGSSVQQQMERARARAEQVRARQAVLQARADELARHSARLETEIAERTRELRLIHDNVSAGLFLLNEAMCIEPGATASAETLLGKPNLDGRHLARLLGLAKRESEWYAASVEQIFEDFLPAEIMADQLPRVFEHLGRTLHFEPRVIRRESDDSVEALLFTVTDITKQIEAEREAQLHKALVQILQQRSAFENFVADARMQLHLAHDAVADQRYVRRVVHTIKGNAGSYGLVDLQQLAHKAEEADLLDHTALTRLDDALTSFLDDHADTLGLSFEDDQAEHTVSDGQLDRLTRLITAPSLDREALMRWAHEVQLRPLGQLLGPVETYVEKISQRLEKPLKWSAAGLDTPVPPEVFQPILQTLSHLIRNAADHGIEPGHQRGDKDAVGHISLLVQDHDRTWSLLLTDDGRGIDTDALLARALSEGLVPAERAARMTLEDCLHLVFLDGLSTAKEATLLSGRGVGMSAVRNAVEKAGGKLLLFSRKGVGTTVRIDMPKPARLVRRPGPVDADNVPA